MSEIIKLNVKSKRLSVSLRNTLESENLETEREEDFFRNQLKQNYEHGYAEGHKAAAEKLEKEFADKLSQKYLAVEGLMNKLESAMNDYEKDFEKIVIALAVIMSEKIVKREISKEPVINEVLKESLRKVLGSNDIHVKINPEDYSAMNKESNSLLTDETYSKIKFEPDEVIERGGCFVETEIGNVDARISSQLNEMKKQLESVFTNKGV